MMASPHVSQDWEGGLDNVLPPRERLPPNVAQPYTEQDMAWEGEADMRGRGRGGPPMEAWGGGGGDRMPHDDVMAMSRRRDAGASRDMPPDQPDLFGRRGPDWGDLPPSRDDQRRMEAESGYGDERVRSRRREQDPRAMNFEDVPVGGGKGPMEENFVVERRRDPGGRNGGMDPRDFRDAPRQGAGWEDMPVGGQQAATAFSVDFNGGRGGGGLPPDDAFSQTPAMARQPPPRARPKAAPEDDCWAGQSLGDAFAPKKASPPAVASAAPRGGGGGGGGGRGGAASASGADCTKTPQEIVTWVRSLPESHVPEKTREQLAAIVEDRRLDGMQFTSFVQTVPPEVCAPKNAMKLKAAWANVLKEAEARQVALANLSNAPKQKAMMIVI